MATLKELRAEAKAAGLTGYSTWSKAELAVAVAESARAEAAPEPEDVPTPPASAFVTIQGPMSWGGTTWSPWFLKRPLRFNIKGQADLCVVDAGVPVVFTYATADGDVDQAIKDKVTEHPDLEVVGG